MAKGVESPQTRRRRRESTQNSRLGSDANGKNVAVEVDLDSDDDSSKDSLYHRKKNRVPGSFALISVSILIMVSLLFVKYMDARLPEALMETDIQDNPTSFIEERARRDLLALTDVGIRVAGSYSNDQITPQEILTILQHIKNEANTTVYDIDMDVQRVSGSFFMDDDEGSTSSYSNIANVVAKIQPTHLQPRSHSGILLNCHFDTKPGSPGGTDDMISCAVMLEILRVISVQETAIIQNPLVLLFNGAEEFGLQGAHGFVEGHTRDSSGTVQIGHPWAQNLTVFLNLEGAGGGGREILFQSAGGRTEHTGWLLKAYTKCPYPYGTVMAEEAFQLGLIPSDTDFRVFRDAGMAGLDIAYIKNGWVYHTKWDRVSEIPPGSLQHMGSNALEMVKHFGNMDLSDHDSAGEMVFFDVLGVFMITYSKTVGIIINVIIALASIAAIIFEGGWKAKSFLMYARYIGSTVLAWGASVGVAALVAVILNGSGYPKSFYSYPSLAFILFGLPAMITQILVYSICLKSSPKDAWLAGKLTQAVILLVATFITRAAYIFTIPLLFGAVGFFSARYLMRGWPRAIMVSYLVVGEFIPLLMSSYLIITLADVFVPILGRSGSEMNGNLFFGLVIAAVVSVFAVPGLVALFVNYDFRVLISCLIISVFLLNSMIVFGFIGKTPYQEKTPMRLTICDVDRTYYNMDGTVRKTQTGYWFWPLDADTDFFFPEFEKTVQELRNVEDIKLDYENCEELYCSQPFIWPTTSIIKKVHWIKKTEGLPLTLRESVKMKIMNDSIVSPTRRQLSLEFVGPPQMNIVLSPHENWEAKITIDVLGEQIPINQEGAMRWKNRKVYYIYHGHGYHAEPLRINIDLTRGPNSGPIEGILEVQQTGLFVEMSDVNTTPKFRDFLSRFPSWTFTGMSWSSVMKMYSL